MKKLISIVIVMLMVLPLIPASAVYTPQFEYEAQMLYDFGLFKGTDKGFELDKKCDRLQAAALFIRLLGKESEALNNPKEHPFTDVPDWASPYVGQMYHDGYTKGISENQYGIGDITANQFATFCLRALGYSEYGPGIWQFNYETALEKMLEHFIIRQDSYDIIKADSIFYRDYAVKMAYNSLFSNMCNVDIGKAKFLIRLLIEDGVVEENKVKNNDIFVDDGIRYYYSPESFKPYFENMIREAAEGNKVVIVFNKHEGMYTNMIHELEPPSLLPQELLYRAGGGGLIQHIEVMADDLTTEWNSGLHLYCRTTINPHGSGGGMAYRCTRYMTHGDVKLTDKEKQVVEKSKEFLATITDDMSDYDKFKAARDFLCKNVKYNNNKIVSGDIEVLVDGEAICQGYATTYMYLCRLMGLECWYIGGKYGSYEGHAWNKVKLDGKYYNVEPQGGPFLFKNPSVYDVYPVGLKVYDFPSTEDYQH